MKSIPQTSRSYLPLGVLCEKQDSCTGYVFRNACCGRLWYADRRSYKFMLQQRRRRNWRVGDNHGSRAREDQARARIGGRQAGGSWSFGATPLSQQLAWLAILFAVVDGFGGGALRLRSGGSDAKPQIDGQLRSKGEFVRCSGAAGGSDGRWWIL